MYHISQFLVQYSYFCWSPLQNSHQVSFRIFPHLVVDHPLARMHTCWFHIVSLGADLCTYTRIQPNLLHYRRSSRECIDKDGWSLWLRVIYTQTSPRKCRFVHRRVHRCDQNLRVFVSMFVYTQMPCIYTRRVVPYSRYVILASILCHCTCRVFSPRKPVSWGYDSALFSPFSHWQILIYSFFQIRRHSTLPTSTGHVNFFGYSWLWWTPQQIFWTRDFAYSPISAW